MSAKFQIVASLESNALHLQMRGEFDGSAACDLIRMLEDGRETAPQVLVDTTDLSSIHPFGKTVFDHRIGRLSKTTPGLLFIGKNRHHFQS
jgi:hypothetical protein